MEKAESRGCIRMRIIEYHDYKTLLGPCFISFSIPLLVPGVVLTVVGSYGNEHTFSRFGAWHVTGIVILCFATVLLIAGILLKCCFRPVMSADIEQHLSPNPSMVTGSRALGSTEDDDLGSTGSQQRGNGNKVSPLHQTGHKVVSTHERRHRHKDHPNGAVGGDHREHREHRTQTKTSETLKKSTTKRRASDVQEAQTVSDKGVTKNEHRHRKHSESEHNQTRAHHVAEADIVKEPPPSYEEVTPRQINPNTSLQSNAHAGDSNAISKAVETPPIVMDMHIDTSVVMGGKPQSGSHVRENSSDANENSR